jgi:hypothetical protein
MSGGDEEDAEMRARAREERLQIVKKYDLGREEGAVIDDWEDPRLELYHKKDRSVTTSYSCRFYEPLLVKGFFRR